MQALISIRVVGGKKISRRFLSHDTIQVLKGQSVLLLLFYYFLMKERGDVYGEWDMLWILHVYCMFELTLFIFIFSLFFFFFFFFPPFFFIFFRHSMILLIQRLRVLNLSLTFFFPISLVVNMMIFNLLWRFFFFLKKFIYHFFFLCCLF